jgi:probable HAF family extracellular repeat protein
MRHSILPCAGLGALLLPLAALATTRYHFVDLTPDAPAATQVLAMNTGGSAVGYEYVARHGTRTKAARFKSTGTVLFEPFGDPATNMVYAINAAGHIAGIGSTATETGYHAFATLGQHQTYRLFAGDDVSIAYGIDADDTVVGYVRMQPQPDGVFQPFAWNAGQGRLLPTGGATGGVARAVRDGTIVGQVGVDDAYLHAAMWRGDTLTELGILPDVGPTSWANAVNGAGTAVGACGLESFTHACSFHDGVVTDLGVLGAAQRSGWTAANAYAIDDAGTIVGFTTTPTHQGSVAFIMSPGGPMVDLNTLVGDLPAGSQLLDARAIAKDGSIAVTWAPTYRSPGHAAMLVPLD